MKNSPCKNVAQSKAELIESVKRTSTFFFSWLPAVGVIDPLDAAPIMVYVQFASLANNIVMQLLPAGGTLFKLALSVGKKILVKELGFVPEDLNFYFYQPYLFEFRRATFIGDDEENASAPKEQRMLQSITLSSKPNVKIFDPALEVNGTMVKFVPAAETLPNGNIKLELAAGVLLAGEVILKLRLCERYDLDKPITVATEIASEKAWQAAADASKLEEEAKLEEGESDATLLHAL